MERIDEEYPSGIIAMCQESEMTASEYMGEVRFYTLYLLYLVNPLFLDIQSGARQHSYECGDGQQVRGSYW